MARPDITLWGATYPTVPAVDLPTSNNATTRFYDRNGPLDFLGAEIEFMQEVYDTTTKLEDTDFATWTPSTTATTIKTTENLTYKPVLNLAQYEYALRWKFLFDPVYNGSQTNKARTVKTVMNLWQLISKRANSLANIGTKNHAGNVCATLTSAAILDYYNSSSTHTYTWSASYGVYCAATAATFSNSTSNTPTLTIKTPAVSARCSTTYLSTANAACIDQTDSTFRIIGELYRYKPMGILLREYDELCDLYNNFD